MLSRRNGIEESNYSNFLVVILLVIGACTGKLEGKIELCLVQ